MQGGRRQGTQDIEIKGVKGRLAWWESGEVKRKGFCTSCGFAVMYGLYIQSLKQRRQEKRKRHKGINGIWDKGIFSVKLINPTNSRNLGNGIKGITAKLHKAKDSSVGMFAVSVPKNARVRRARQCKTCSCKMSAKGGIAL